MVPRTHKAKTKLVVQEWIRPWPGSLDEAIEAFDKHVTLDDELKDAFSSFSEMMDDKRNMCVAEEVATDSGLSCLQIFTALFGPSGDFYSRYHKRRGNSELKARGKLCSEEEHSESGDIASTTTSASSKPPTRLDWCGIGSTSFTARSHYGRVPMKEKVRFIACQSRDKDVVGLHVSTTSSCVPGSGAFRIEQLYNFTQINGEKAVELRVWTFVKFIASTPLRSIIERTATSDLKDAYKTFVHEVRRCARNASPNGQEAPESSSDDAADAAKSLPTTTSRMAAWLLRPALSPAHVIFPIIILVGARHLLHVQPILPYFDFF
jgi:hypothetical protein